MQRDTALCNQTECWLANYCLRNPATRESAGGGIVGSNQVFSDFPRVEDGYECEYYLPVLRVSDLDDLVP